MSAARNADRIFDADARIEAMFWLPSIAGAESPPQLFDDSFCEYLPDDASHQLYKDLPQLAKFADADDYPSGDDVAEALRGTTEGFLFQGSHPIRDYDEDGHSWLSSWGYYRTCWFYARTEGEIVDKLVAWAAACDETDRAKKRVAP